jgi:hypothetical protein
LFTATFFNFSEIYFIKKIILLYAAIASFTVMAFTVREVLPIGSDMPKADVKLQDISGTSISIKAVKKNKTVYWLCLAAIPAPM